MTAVALVGVTASGKSEAALELARRRGDCEIVSVDSMCVYRGMDIGTSKPGPEARAAVPHHLLDLVDPGRGLHRDPVPAGGPRRRWRGIAARGHHALLVGGTGLYLRAVVDDLAIPGRYPEVAAALEAELDEGRAETADLHARLAALDPVGAARMEPTNRRRVVRALEVTLGVGPALLRVRPRARGLPGQPGCAQVGLRSAARRGRPAHRGPLRRHGRGRPGRRGAGAGRPARRDSRARPARRSATARSWPTWRTARPLTTAWRRRSGAPASSPAARPRGSAATRASPGPTSAAEAQALLEQALAVHG